MFIKPHGQLDSVKAVVEKALAHANIRIVSRGDVDGRAIDAAGLIDRHYAAIAAYALQGPASVPMTAGKLDEFATKYGVSWTDAVSSGKAFANVNEALEQLGVDASELNTLSRAGVGMKLAPGCYVAYLKHHDRFVVNGFYAAMRAEYVRPDAHVSWMIVEWDVAALSWKDFRANVLGATDPTAARQGSIRKQILDHAQELGLSFTPGTGTNCVHGSASPLEALKERMIWASASLEDDAFAKALMARPALSAGDVDQLLENPATSSGTPLFDVVEDTDTEECIRMLDEYVARKTE